MKLKRCRLIVILILLVFIGSNITIKENKIIADRFKTVKDDAIAKRFTPIIIVNNNYEKPINLYYRAAFDLKGNEYIAYHFIWPFEKNNNKSLKPFLNRILYTGGLNLQRIIFGKGDVEVIEVKLDKNKNVIRVKYEEPQNYEKSNFSVEHKKVEIKDNLQENLYFEIASWNHLFNYIKKYDENKNDVEVKLIPKYFTNQLWDEYEMVKEKEKIFKRSRAHYEYELLSKF